jgi:hypothetical protein
MTTTITCTKSTFRSALTLDHAVALSDTSGTVDVAELTKVIDGLVEQANQHRGVFEGHSAYLDCDFIVSPDEPAETAPAKTIADYVPGAGVKRMLVELSYLNGYNATFAVRMVRTAVDAECGEQMITAHLADPLDEISYWIAEQVHEIRANR